MIMHTNIQKLQFYNLSQPMHIQMTIEQFSIIMAGIIIMIILYALIGTYFQHKQFHYLHETGAGIIIGFIFGLLLYLINQFQNYQFNQQIFFYGLLPPIIFSGGYNLKKKKFFQNFTYIVTFGLFGTLVTFGIILGLTFLINQYRLIRNWSNFDDEIILSTALIIKFSATICATDSVAALTIIKPKQYPKLFSIVFGQGMVNDAVAIILFRVVGNMFGDQTHDQPLPLKIGKVLGLFLLNLCGSFLIGMVLALICTKLFQTARFLTHNAVIEVTISYLFGILSYVIAEIAQLSGVITVLVCGVVLAHFNFYNLSRTGSIATGVTFQTISFIAQSFVFIYLGISTMFYITHQTLSYTFILLELAICVIGRFGAIFGLTMIVKCFMKKWNVSLYQLLIISLAGTIRGSVAFALILTIEGQQESVEVVKSSILLIVFITTIFLGAAMPSLITTILSKDPTQAENRQTLILQDERQMKGQDLEEQQVKKSTFKRFDEQFLKPFFIYDYVKRKPQIKQFKKLLKLNSPDYKGGQFEGMVQTHRQSYLPKQKASVYTFE